MEEGKRIKVLVVDHDRIIRDLLLRFLNTQSTQVTLAQDGFAALKAAEQERFDLVFMEVKMPGMDGIRTFGELKRIIPSLRCVFMSKEAQDLSFLKSSGQVCLRKPFEDLKLIKEAMEQALKDYQPQMEGRPVEERRAYRRLEVPLEVEYRQKQAQAKFQRALCRNVSPLGTGLYVQEDLPLSAKLDMTIKIPGKRETCQVGGEVIWSQKCESKPGYYMVGVRLTEMDLDRLMGILLEGGQLSDKDI